MAFDYDLIVIGGGAAGLTAAGMGGHMGAKTLLVEKQKLGGECTWAGCVPSKALLNAAETAHKVRTASDVGIRATLEPVDLGQVLSRVHRIQHAIYEDADRPEIYEDRGVGVVAGDAKFVDDRTIVIQGVTRETKLTSRYFVIATGSSPVVPPVPGLREANPLTNETVFGQDSLPETLAVIGAGPVGVELSQAFQRLGSGVTVIEMGDRILAKDDPELSAMLLEALQDEGVRFELGSKLQEVRSTGDEHSLILDDGVVVNADKILVAAGRRPNLDGLNLTGADIVHDERGIRIDDRCRTSRRHIFATGDVTGRMPFTHSAEEMSKTAVMNALIPIPFVAPKVHWEQIPWVTFTEPELGHVGRVEGDLRASREKFATYWFPYDRIDRAVTAGATRGKIKIYAHPWTGRIYGADILGAGAGELIGHISLAMRNRVPIGELSRTLHPYPTLVLGNRRAADQWHIQKVRPGFIRWLKRIRGLRGNVPPPPDPDVVI